jgi:hypothetical protein
MKSSNTCAKCKHKRRKLNDPVGYTYDLIKANARRRGKAFEITLDYFRELCKATGYIENKGRRPESLSLDRINPNFGYIEGNVRVITLSVNSSRAFDDVDHDPLDDLPF